MQNLLKKGGMAQFWRHTEMRLGTQSNELELVNFERLSSYAAFLKKRWESSIQRRLDIAIAFQLLTTGIHLSAMYFYATTKILESLSHYQFSHPQDHRRNVQEPRLPSNFKNNNLWSKTVEGCESLVKSPQKDRHS